MSDILFDRWLFITIFEDGFEEYQNIIFAHCSLCAYATKFVETLMNT